jgi:YD repeat-containing protein
MGRTVSYGFADGNLAWSKDNAGDVWGFGYEPGTHLLTSVTDPRGYQTVIRYRGNRVSSVSEPGLGKTTWAYSGDAAAPQGGTTAERQPNGAVTTYDFRALELVAVTAGSGTPEAATTGYTYTNGLNGSQRAGLVSSQTDPELNVTSYQYDQYANLTSETNPLGRRTTYTCDGQWGQVASVTLPGPNGLRQTYGYDSANGELTGATDGAENHTSYQYGRPELR